MSGISSKNVDTILPEDIEKKLADVQKIIADLMVQKDFYNRDVEVKRAEHIAIQKQIFDANTELNRITGLFESKKREIGDKEESLRLKESALNTYANALEDKEKRINKYLNIFERMKDVVNK